MIQSTLSHRPVGKHISHKYTPHSCTITDDFSKPGQSLKLFTTHWYSSANVFIFTEYSLQNLHQTYVCVSLAAFKQFASLSANMLENTIKHRIIYISWLYLKSCMTSKFQSFMPVQIKATLAKSLFCCFAPDMEAAWSKWQLQHATEWATAVMRSWESREKTKEYAPKT